MMRERGSPAEVHENRTDTEEKPEESLTEAPAAALKSVEEEDKDIQNEESELKEGTETESSSTPAVNEWEHLGVVSISVRVY